MEKLVFSYLNTTFDNPKFLEVYKGAQLYQPYTFVPHYEIIFELGKNNQIVFDSFRKLKANGYVVSTLTRLFDLSVQESKRLFIQWFEKKYEIKIYDLYDKSYINLNPNEKIIIPLPEREISEHLSGEKTSMVV